MELGIMAIKCFRDPLELNFIGRAWNLRVGVKQTALWRNYVPIFDWRKRSKLAAVSTSNRTGNQVYGWFDDPWQTEPSYDPPHDAPCLFCGKPVAPDDVRTHSLMYAGPVYAKRSYFYRTHRTCADADPTCTAMDDVVLDMISRNQD